MVFSKLSQWCMFEVIRANARFGGVGRVVNLVIIDIADELVVPRRITCTYK